MYDVLVVGQGLVGSLLGLSLLQAGKRVLVVDDGHRTSSTRVAAGVMNPITGMRLTPLFSSLAAHQAVIAGYRALEDLLGRHFLYAYDLVRFLSKPREKDYFSRRIQASEFLEWIHPLASVSEYAPFCHTTLPAFLTESVFRVDTEVFLDAAKAYLIARQAYRCASFAYTDLQVGESGVIWKEVSAKLCVFCEGYRSEENPFFSFLTFKPARGHILHVSCPDGPSRTILHHGHWFCPVGEGMYRYGATAYWDASESASKKSLLNLESSLASFLKKAYAICGHSFGIRPVLATQTPYAQIHPQWPSLAMITGFGGQGIGMAPGVVHHFVQRDVLGF